MAFASPSWSPFRERSPAKTTASSSEVRCASVARRHCPRISSPSKSPRTVCVFPTSTARVRTHQQVYYPAAPWDMQVRVKVREPLEVEGARYPGVRDLKVQFVYELF